MKVVYLHGWQSSPNSTKVQALQNFYEVLAPELSTDPKESYAAIYALLSKPENKKVILVGTSLGGYWANYFAEKYLLPAVIINPSTNPKQTIGFDVAPSQVNELPILRRVLLAKDDDVIDYRIAAELYQNNAQVKVFEQGGHRFHEIDIIKEEIDGLMAALELGSQG